MPLLQMVKKTNKTRHLHWAPKSCGLGQNISTPVACLFKITQSSFDVRKTLRNSRISNAAQANHELQTRCQSRASRSRVQRHADLQCMFIDYHVLLAALDPVAF